VSREINCAAGCGAKATIARTDDVAPLLGICFAVFNHLELTRHGFILDGGVWWCRYCITRKRLVRLVPPDDRRDNVTSIRAPSVRKK
jgi:hypothetical protein